VLSSSAISVGLVGIRRLEELEENVQAADWAMTEAEREEIRAVASS
jgi:aryl-alcohol dehydrogenase-like predicted oxidoreductase